jgi:hypothetical protein
MATKQATHGRQFHPRAGGHGKPGRDARRLLRIECLEERAVLDVTVSGSIFLDAAAGSAPVSRASLSITVQVATNVPGAPMEMTESGDTYTSGSFFVDFPVGNGERLAAGTPIQVHVTTTAENYFVAPNCPYAVYQGDASDNPQQLYGLTFSHQVTAAEAAATTINLGSLAVGSGSAANEKVDNGIIAANVHGAFEAFAVLCNYEIFAEQLRGLSPGTVTVVYPELTSRSSHYADGTIYLKAQEFAEDAKVLGHEYGHAVADQAGFLTTGIGGRHRRDENQRLFPNPSLPDTLTVEDAQAAFNEGFADWFAVSGAVNVATGLGTVPGFADPKILYGQQYYQDFDGRGEDDETSVAEIMCELETNPLAKAVCPDGSKSVYNFARNSGGTLLGLWNALTSGVDDATRYDLSTIFADHNVAPSPAAVDETHSTPWIDFYLPVVSNLTGADGCMNAETFDTIYVNVTDDSGDVILNHKFTLVSDPFDDAQWTVAMPRPAVAPEAVDTDGQVYYEAPAKNDSEDTPTQLLVDWEITPADWSAAVGKALADDPNFLSDPVCYYTVTGGNTCFGTGTGATSGYESAPKEFEFADPTPKPTSFKATSAGQNTLDLAYNIVTPPDAPGGGGPGGTLPASTILIYASASGVFDDPDNQLAGSYAIAIGTLDANGNDALSGTANNYQRLLNLDASQVSGQVLNGYFYEYSDYYIMAEVVPTALLGTDDADAYGSWARLQLGAFQTGYGYNGAGFDAIHVQGLCSLDTPEPEGFAAEQITLSGSGTSAVTVQDTNGDGDPADSYSRQFSFESYENANSIDVHGHGGGDVVDGSALNSDYSPIFQTVCGVGDDTVIGSAGYNIMVPGDGDDTFDAGPNRSVYAFTDNFVGSIQVVANADPTNENDDLDFSQLSQGISVDMGSTQAQQVTPELALTLGSGTNVWSALGTSYADTIAACNDNDYIDGNGGGDTLIDGGPGTYLVDTGYGNTFECSTPLPYGGSYFFNSDGYGTVQFDGSESLLVQQHPDGGGTAWPPGYYNNTVGWIGMSSVTFAGGGSGQALTFDGGGSVDVSGLPDGANLAVDNGTQLDLGGCSATLGSVTVSDGGGISDGTISATSYSLADATIAANLSGPEG